MITLSQHLQRLLLDTDCVAVPGLGCFVVHAMPARYIESDAVLVPPSRVVSFHSMVLGEDTRLTQAYMIALDVTREEAEKHIVYEVAQLKREIQLVGEVAIEGVGTLSLTYSGKYYFTPQRNGAYSCQFLGLERMLCPQRTQEIVQEHVHTTLLSGEIEEDKSGWETLRVVAKEGLKYAAIFIVMLLSYFMISYPLDVKDAGNQSIAGWSYQLWQGVNEKLSAVVTAILGVEPKQVSLAEPIRVTRIESSKATNSITSITDTLDTTQHFKESKTSRELFTIVLASATTEKNAEAMVRRLHSKGYKEVSVMRRKRMVRVVMGHYNDKQEANQVASQLHRTSNPDVMHAWIMQVPPK